MPRIIKKFNITSLKSDSKEFDSIVADYLKLQKEIKEKQYILDNYKKIIKDLMEKEQLETKINKNYYLSRTRRVSINYREGLLINKLKSLGLEKAVKTKEFLDKDELESLIYNELIKYDDIKDFIEEKVTYALTVKEV